MPAERSSTSDRAFLDTNVLVYAVDDGEPEKRRVARELLGSAAHVQFTLSAQILGEFYVTVTRRLAQPLAPDVAAATVELLSQLPTVAIDASLVAEAVELSRTAQLSYWDGLVLVAAARGGCRRLLSEDLNDGQRFGPVQVENPFA